jgi:hypothetical protein
MLILLGPALALAQFGGAGQSQQPSSQPGYPPHSSTLPYSAPPNRSQPYGAATLPPTSNPSGPSAQRPGQPVGNPYFEPQAAVPAQQGAPSPAAVPNQQPGHPLQQPLYRVAATPTPPGTIDPSASPNPHVQRADPQQLIEHPLMPALRWAREGLPAIRNIQDYSCILHKRELVDGQLGEHQAMLAKVRHQPFSVYLYFLSPPNLRGQEVIYVAGRNDNKLQAHGVGLRGAVGTVSLHPEGHMAMRGNRYPITELGVLNLVERLIQVGDRDSHYGECDVQFLKAKVAGRSSTCIQVTHPVPRRNFLFHLARIYVDDELNLPIRYEAWDWPAQQGGQPQLMEEYTYVNLKLNNGFTDLDFDPKNPKYGFR